jgi:diguanylate cyclase (GGDEF)-like protein
MTNNIDKGREPVTTDSKRRFAGHLSLAAINAAVSEVQSGPREAKNASMGDILTAALQRAAIANAETAMLVLRINDYRELSETLGETFGTDLAREVESRLHECLRTYDVAERVSDDEFAIVLDRLDKLDDVTQIASRLVASCSGAYAFEGVSSHVKVAVGIALCPPNGEPLETLLRFARIALRGTTDGEVTGCQFFSSELLERQQRRVWMEAELERALEEDRFVLHYQPQYAAEDAQIVGVEALVRMRSASGELIPPDDFIPIAESNGFVVQLGEWVIGEACRQLAYWRGRGYGTLRMAVNVSPQQLLQEGLVETISNAVTKYQLDYSDLEIEITEQPMLEGSPVVAKVLADLHEKGVRIAIDDFGTGYSSFAYLSRLPLNMIKMDRSFLTDISTDPRAGQVATAMIAMARELGFEIIVEGVETPAQRRFLLTSGCDMGQGFGLARPQEAEAIEQLLMQSLAISAVS